MAQSCQHVIVVDPEPWLHMDLTRALRSRNITVLVASSSGLALQAVGNGFKPDAVLIGFARTDADSAKLLRHVKSAHAAFTIALVPDVSLNRIGPIPDRELREPLHVNEVLVALGDSSTSPEDLSMQSGEVVGSSLLT